MRVTLPSERSIQHISRRWNLAHRANRKSFRQFVMADLNSESLYDGTKFMAGAGAVCAALGYLMGSILFEVSSTIFFTLAAGFFLFLLRWYFLPSP